MGPGNESDYVGVWRDAKMVYVLVASRGKFDQIPLEVKEHDHRAQNRGHVLSKTCASEGLTIVFQHWLESIDHTKPMFGPEPI